MSEADVATVATGDGPDGALELVDQLRRGDPAADTELVERYGACAYRIARGITRNTADAEEVVQDALASALGMIDSFGDDAAFGAWLYWIVTNAACDKARRSGPRGAEMRLEGPLPVPMVDDWSGRLEDPAVRRRVGSALSAAMDDLSPDDRAVVILRDVEGLTIGDVAASIGITVANAKTRLHHARLVLRARLGDSMTAAP